MNFKKLLTNAGLLALSIITGKYVWPMRMKANSVVDKVQEISKSLPEISRVDFHRKVFELEGLKDALENDSLNDSERLEKVDSLLKEFLGEFREAQAKSSKAKILADVEAKAQAQEEMLKLMKENEGKSFDDILNELPKTDRDAYYSIWGTPENPIYTPKEQAVRERYNNEPVQRFAFQIEADEFPTLRKERLERHVNSPLTAFEANYRIPGISRTVGELLSGVYTDNTLYKDIMTAIYYLDDQAKAIEQEYKYSQEHTNLHEDIEPSVEKVLERRLEKYRKRIVEEKIDHYHRKSSR